MWGLVRWFDVLPILRSHIGSSDEVVASTNGDSPAVGSHIPAFETGAVHNLLVVIGTKRHPSLVYEIAIASLGVDAADVFGPASSAPPFAVYVFRDREGVSAWGAGAPALG